MSLRWRFSGVILFSLTFHALLISAMFYAYPDLKNKSEWILKEFSLFPTEIKPTSFSSFDKKEINQKIISKDKMIFPDLVIIRKHKNSSTTKIKKLSLIHI